MPAENCFCNLLIISKITCGNAKWTFWNKDAMSKTLIMNRHKKIASFFDDDFWVTR
jgi:hypothetical protein